MGRRGIGRPRKGFEPGERVALSLRLTPELKQRLDETVDRNGRSQSQECEMRLAQSFLLEDMLKARLISMRVTAPMMKE